ncbi:efflux RND transporter periplasmic adaptor subunit [Rhabdochlamydiaceae symbiont of Dictyostelium giganteum]|uniref:efflux RND transporter periplasmic adaptor subunit n=1 Tax=Rhabdochlamydiaceae symbiont of Dictyostelium giganteum TaxID=3342349 RepID=UPI00384E8AB7
MGKKSIIISCLGAVSIIALLQKTLHTPPADSLLIEPVQKPFVKLIAASGIIEAFGENLHIGSPESGLVEEVYVNVGDHVVEGDPLFQLDTSSLKARLKTQEAKEQVALMEHKLIKDQLDRFSLLRHSHSISQQEMTSKENEERLYLAKLHLVQEEKKETKRLIDRLLVKAPITGTILQKNIHKGEWIMMADPHASPLVMGNTSLLQIRTDIDEHNAKHITLLAIGVVSPKNQPEVSIPLKFVRIEPYIIPKRSLTGSSRERVDTRVLQVIYAFHPLENHPLYIGQQVDVFIEKESALQNASAS